MKELEIQLLQFIICEKFQPQKQDGYLVEGVRSNLYVPEFPFRFQQHCVVTCWRKDRKFHKEVIEYETEEGEVTRSSHMDIEPIRDNVLFRWHTHKFPRTLVIQKPMTLWIRVVLDWKVFFQSYLLIEKLP